MTETAWDRAALALQMLALEPARLGGAIIRMRVGPQRDAITDRLGRLRKIPLSITDTQLFGGLDIPATLRLGRKIYTRGILNAPHPMALPMAERCPPALNARLAQAMDRGDIAGLICLDEGIGPDEATPAALADRMAFFLSPDGHPPSNWPGTPPEHHVAAAARISPAQIETLVTVAQQLGIGSARAPLMAIVAAQTHARLQGRDLVLDEDISVASALVYPHRATCLPEDCAEDDAADTPPEHPPEQPDGPENEAQAPASELPVDMLVATVAALLPDDVLHRIATARAGQAKGQGAGEIRKSNRRGRPLPPRAGRADGQSRIDLVATLRAAAPWQTLRRAQYPNGAAPPHAKVLLRGQDIRVKRFQQRSDRVLIFAVDASGSAALARLGEAKGAVELLLAEAYARRDHVALIAFRGTGADVLLPPTRSLVQTKRRLAALPGGGGTPLAAGLQEANSQARLARLRGLAPSVVLLTDGRANIALDGSANRQAAQSDAQGQAQALRRDGTQGLVIDMGLRPSAALEHLSHTLDSPYMPLPRADAHRLHSAIQGALSQ